VEIHDRSKCQDVHFRPFSASSAANAAKQLLGRESVVVDAVVVPYGLAAAGQLAHAGLMPATPVLIIPLCT